MSNNTQFSDIFPFTKDELQLEKLAEKYPWYSIAQLSLLQLYKKNNSTKFEKQATRVALYFNNPTWINWQLHILYKENNIDESHPQKESAAVVEDAKQNEKIPQLLSEISMQKNNSDELIQFEPLHTVDYFASQGIKITDEPATNDKLGNQMKSFTEWLKSMKKIHKEKIAEGDEQTDKNIRQIAEHSNAEAEVITEAMANVLVNQNKNEKAIEVYEKLSLINPSKSAYFAAKIDSLNTP